MSVTSMDEDGNITEYRQDPATPEPPLNDALVTEARYDLLAACEAAQDYIEEVLKEYFYRYHKMTADEFAEHTIDFGIEDQLEAAVNKARGIINEETEVTDSPMTTAELEAAGQQVLL